MKTEASRRNMQSKFDQTSVYASDFNGILVLCTAKFGTIDFRIKPRKEIDVQIDKLEKGTLSFIR